MNISIGHLTITSFCEDNASHLSFRRELFHDKVFSQFLRFSCEEELIKTPSNENEIQLRNSYFIQDNSELIGWIYLGGYQKEASLDIAVHPNFRNRGYGSMILNECCSYLFQNHIADEVEFMIHKNNESSLKCIEKIKSKVKGKMGEFIIYKCYKKDC